MATWLKCEEVARGMFSDERAVTIMRVDGATESVFVPKDEVDDVRKLVRVVADPVGQNTLAIIPTSHPTRILVKPDQIITE